MGAIGLATRAASIVRRARNEAGNALRSGREPRERSWHAARRDFMADPAPLLVVDRDARVVDANRAAGKAVGVPCHHLPGRRLASSLGSPRRWTEARDAIVLLQWGPVRSPQPLAVRVVGVSEGRRGKMTLLIHPATRAPSPEWVGDVAASIDAAALRSG
jgi:hypothetical protein